MKQKIKNIFNVTMIITFLVLMVWFMASFADIIADNNKPNPTHHKYNAFVLLTNAFDNEDTASCGNPLDGTTHIAFGSVYAICEDSIIFITDDGNLYEAFVGEPQEYDTNGYYCLFFQGEQIFKTWKEVW